MNGFFQLSVKSDGTYIKVLPPDSLGEKLKFDTVREYFDKNKIEYDIVEANKAVNTADGNYHKITNMQLQSLHEQDIIKISDDHMTAYAIFFAPFEGAGLMTMQEFVRDLAYNKICFGIDTSKIEQFFEKKEYCRQIVVASGLAPVDGKNAYIDYSFNTNRHISPAVKADGSVDFFNLNLIKNCHKGDLLAQLTPADLGTPGKTVLNENVKQHTVRVMSLRFGKNVVISDDKLKLYAGSNGNISMDGSKVIVSNVLKLENVDVSTGNIEYDGSVEINGNVAAGFKVTAGGNISVKGSVEGVQLNAGADIILECGMNGMGRGLVHAGGSIVTKFIENANVYAAGSIVCESIIHSKVVSETCITVEGRKGNIIGGNVSATEKIIAKTIGSEMGIDTTISVGVSSELKNSIMTLLREITDSKKKLESITPAISNFSEKMRSGVSLTPKQLEYLQQIALLGKSLESNIQEKTEKVAILQDKAMESKNAEIVVTYACYPGTLIAIGNISSNVKQMVSHSKFILDNGDIRTVVM